ncbi:hypothetical protein GCM10010254_11940 [Streptomyces chromofuscus]|uniref:Transposase n=2 Tax=Streptomyces chromofuscus TaxID=42881 RepID=A0A7M2T328_STRCW|nr:transposase [Streptomyces chromofuscus]GGS93551.1 hypothetical protein GCM10010254_11940 [Streptomyces chromofuscus]
MSTSYRAAVRTGLPHATIVVDHFHVVQLANKMLSTVRRRTTATLRGRRGRATDPEWRTRCRLLCNREDLAEKQFTKMRNALMDAGQIGMTLLTAWIAQERLRDLLALARTGANRERFGHLRWKFLTWCADSEVPEVRQLAVTLDCWWPEIAAFIATGHSNATSEGVKRMIKLCARNTHGFRNPTNQRLRTRCVTTRRARGHLAPLNFVDPPKVSKTVPVANSTGASRRPAGSPASRGWRSCPRLVSTPRPLEPRPTL